MNQLPESQFRDESLNIAAHERTFDGAYTRTVFNVISTGMIIYRIFGIEFAPIGLVFIVFGFSLYVVGLWRRWSSGRMPPVENKPIRQNENRFEMSDLKIEAEVGTSESALMHDRRVSLPRSETHEISGVYSKSFSLTDIGTPCDQAE